MGENEIAGRNVTSGDVGKDLGKYLLKTAPVEDVGSLTVEEKLPEDTETLQGMLKAERMRNADLTGRLATSVPMILTYQPYVTQAPQTMQQQWDQACLADGKTSETWRDLWLDHIARNVEENDADSRTVEDMYGDYAHLPCLCVAAGPSLKRNFHSIKDVPEDLPVISCLHSFNKFVDEDTRCTAFVTLDAGDVVLRELYFGGKHPEQYYWDATKDYTLISGLVTPPELIKRWQGPVKFFNATIPDPRFMEIMPKTTKNTWVYSVGGSTYGAALYHAAWIWGCPELALAGADFAFDYMHKFHPWDSEYDTQFQGLVPCTDVYGNRVFSWPSYQNFRAWTEFQCQGSFAKHNIRIINCTEGGTLGAYPHGNVMWIEQKNLVDWIDQHKRWSQYKDKMAEREPGSYMVMW